MQTRDTDSKYFLFIPARPQGKSYLFFTQFKAELKGTKIEYVNAYVSTKKLLAELLVGLCSFICVWVVKLSQCLAWTKLRNCDCWVLFLCAAEFVIYYCQWADPISRGGLSFSDAFKTRIILAVDTADKYSTWFFKKLAGVRLQVCGWFTVFRAGPWRCKLLKDVHKESRVHPLMAQSRTTPC